MKNPIVSCDRIVQSRHLENLRKYDIYWYRHHQLSYRGNSPLVCYYAHHSREHLNNRSEQNTSSLLHRRRNWFRSTSSDNLLSLLPNMLHSLIPYRRPRALRFRCLNPRTWLFHAAKSRLQRRTNQRLPWHLPRLFIRRLTAPLATLQTFPRLWHKSANS